MRRLLLVLLVLAGAFAGVVAAANLDLGPLVITREGEQKLILRLGEIREVTTPGVSWRVPLLETIQRYDARWLYLDADPLPMQTVEGEQLVVDNFVVWRIEDLAEFRRAFPDGMGAAHQRIDRVVRDGVREVIGRHTLPEVLNEKRVAIMDAITESAQRALGDFGIRVADVRINRTELPRSTEESVYARMRTERERLARRNRAEGEERARRIRAEADREARVLVAEARRDAEILRGEGEAQAARIYAEAYGAQPEFYDFVRSLEAYRRTIDERTTLVLSPNAEFFRYLQGGAAQPPGGASAPGP